jgi:hypothetical protein
MFTAGIKAQWFERGKRILLRDNTGDGVVMLCVVFQAPVCWSLDFRQTPLCKTMYFTAFLLNSDLRRFFRNVSLEVFIRCEALKKGTSLETSHRYNRSDKIWYTM